MILMSFLKKSIKFTKVFVRLASDIDLLVVVAKDNIRIRRKLICITSISCNRNRRFPRSLFFEMNSIPEDRSPF